MRRILLAAVLAGCGGSDPKPKTLAEMVADYCPVKCSDAEAKLVALYPGLDLGAPQYCNVGGSGGYCRISPGAGSAPACSDAIHVIDYWSDTYDDSPAHPEDAIRVYAVRRLGDFSCVKAEPTPCQLNNTACTKEQDGELCLGNGPCDPSSDPQCIYPPSFDFLCQMDDGGGCWADHVGCG